MSAATPALLSSASFEQSVLGSLLQDGGAFERVQPLRAHDFSDHIHGRIYDAIAALTRDGDPVDIVTVYERLRTADQADECGGLEYLGKLEHCVPSAANAGHYAKAVRDLALKRDLLAAVDRMRVALLEEPNTGAALEQARAFFDGVAASAQRPREFFKSVDLSALGQADATEQEWFWDGLIPAGHLTHLGGHGGAGKSTLGLMVAACAVSGSQCLGKATRPARVLFFSGEDPAELVLRRLHRVCLALGLDEAVVRERLHVIDATDFDPVLFFERRADGMRAGATTPTYEALAKYVELHEIDFLVIDNASDTYEADEINRSLVRAFIRSLVRLVRPRNGAVLLLAHVDKGTSRAGKGQTNSEGYSGSTAWHNSARSRLFLLEKEPGAFELQHQKCNLGPKQPAMPLDWPDRGVLQLVGEAEGPSGIVQSINDRNDTRALLRLVAEFTARGEHVSSATTSRTHAARLLRREPTFPGQRRDNEIFDLLRRAEREAWIQRFEFKGADRKHRECWKVTQSGATLAGITLPTREVAATAATPRDFKGGSSGAEPAATAATPPGGMGGRARTTKAAATAREADR